MAEDYAEIEYQRIYEQISYLKPNWRRNRTNAQFNQLIRQIVMQLKQEVRVCLTLDDNAGCDDQILTRSAKALLREQPQKFDKKETSKMNVPVSPLVTSTTNNNEQQQIDEVQLTHSDNAENSNVTKTTVTLVLNMPRIMCDALHTNMVSLDVGNNNDLVNIMTPRVRYLFDTQEQNELSNAINVLEQLHVKDDAIKKQETDKGKPTKKRGRPKNKVSKVITTTTTNVTTAITNETQAAAVGNNSLTSFYENIDWLINSPSATPGNLVHVSSTTQHLNYAQDANFNMQPNQAAATYVVDFTDDGMKFTLAEGTLAFATDNNGTVQTNDTNTGNIWLAGPEANINGEGNNFQPLTCPVPGPMLNNFGEPYVSPLDNAFKSAISMPELNNETADNDKLESSEKIACDKENKSTTELTTNLYEFLDKSITLEDHEEDKINENVWSGLLSNDDVIAFEAEAEAVNRNMELMADINEFLDKSIDNKIETEDEKCKAENAADETVEVKSNKNVEQTNFVESSTNIKKDNSWKPKTSSVEILDVTILKKGSTTCNKNLTLDLIKKNERKDSEEKTQAQKDIIVKNIESKQITDTCASKVDKEEHSKKSIINIEDAAAVEKAIIEPRSEDKKDTIISDVKHVKKNDEEKIKIKTKESTINGRKNACQYIIKPFVVRIRRSKIIRSKWRQMKSRRKHSKLKDADKGRVLKIILKRNKINNSEEAVESATWTIQPVKQDLQENVKPEADDAEQHTEPQIQHEPQQDNEPQQEQEPQQQQQQEPQQQQQQQEPQQQQLLNKQKEDEKSIKSDDIKQILDLRDELLDFDDDDDDVLLLTASPIRDLEETEEKYEQKYCTNFIPKCEENDILKTFKIPKLSKNTTAPTVAKTTTTNGMQWTESLPTSTTFKNVLNDFSYEMPKRIKNDTLPTVGTSNKFMQEIKENNITKPIMNNVEQQQIQSTSMPLQQFRSCMPEKNFNNIQKLIIDNSQEVEQKTCSALPFISPTAIKFPKTTPSKQLFSFNQYVKDTNALPQQINIQSLVHNNILTHTENSLSVDNKTLHTFSQTLYNETVALTNNPQEVMQLSAATNPIIRPSMHSKKFIIPDDCKIVKTIANNISEQAEEQLHINEYDVEETEILKFVKLFGIDCWLFFIGKCSVTSNCGRNHGMRSVEEIQLAISLLGSHDLELAYRFVLHYAKLYELYICCFCRLWAQRRDTERLLHLATDCQLYDNTVRSIIYEHLCPALLLCGLNPVVICRELLLRLRRNPSNKMLHVLLELIMECGQWTRFVLDIDRLLSFPHFDMPLNVVWEMVRACTKQTSNLEIRNLTFKCMLKLNLENLARIQHIPFILNFVHSVKQSAPKI